MEIKTKTYTRIFKNLISEKMLTETVITSLNYIRLYSVSSGS